MSLKNGVVSLIIAIIMVLSIISVFVPEKADSIVGTTLYVGGSGPGHYKSIQSAIDDASDGDTVFVYNGIYYENVVVNKRINLMGKNKNTTIIDAGGFGIVVEVSADWVNLSGFTIQNGFNDYGVFLSYSSNNTITGNIITNNDNGIALSYSSNKNTIMGNTINSNNNDGITLDLSSNNNTIMGNTINSNNNDGIALSYSSSNTITGNTITNNDNGIYLHYHSYRSSGTTNGNTITDNIISNNDNGIYLYLYSAYSSGAITGNIITGNIITNNNDGIYIYYHSYHSSGAITGNIITGNTITNNNDGIYLYDSSSNTVTGNTIANNNYGIYLNSSSSNKIYHNNFIDNSIHAATSYEGMNTWDNGYPSGGSYWDNYTGVDVNSDHIGDIPYYIPGGNNLDRYPLMILYNLTINQSPIANFEHTPVSPVKVNASIDFMDTSTDADGNIVRWVWNFGDGSTAQGAQVNHTYMGKGVYMVTLTVTDDDGETDSFTRAVTIESDEDDDGGIPGFELIPLMLSFLGLLFLVGRKRSHGQM